MKYPRCVYCEGRLKEKRWLTQEHLVPLSKGGNNSIHNKRDCCFSCNGWRANSDLEKWKYEVQFFSDNSQGRYMHGKRYTKRRLRYILTNIPLIQKYICDSGDILFKQPKAI